MQPRENAEQRKEQGKPAGARKRHKAGKGKTMKTITEKALLKRLESDGYKAERAQVFHGYYYDGTEHGESVPAVVVSVEYGESILPVINAMEKAGYMVKWLSRRAAAYTPADYEKAGKLDKTAAAFLDAFWTDLHNNPAHGENNAQKAIQAARLAIA